MAMLLLSSGCATYQPERTDNICSIFRGDTDWYKSAREANKRWGTPVWEKYMRETGNSGDDRDGFSNVVNFVGWYTNTTQRTLGISKWDAYHQYLAYHEGPGGYKSGRWKGKGWLKQVANKVRDKSAAYNAQLKKS